MTYHNRPDHEGKCDGYKNAWDSIKEETATYCEVRRREKK